MNSYVWLVKFHKKYHFWWNSKITIKLIFQKPIPILYVTGFLIIDLTKITLPVLNTDNVKVWHWQLLPHMGWQRVHLHASLFPMSIYKYSIYKFIIYFQFFLLFSKAIYKLCTFYPEQIQSLNNKQRLKIFVLTRYNRKYKIYG